MTGSGDLANQVQEFAQELSDTFNNVLDGTHELALHQVDSRWILEPQRRTNDDKEIPWIDLRLQPDGPRIGRLQFRHEMSLDHRAKYLKVTFSSCTIRAEADGSALLRLDYQPNNMKGDRAPVVHWQIQAHHNAFASWLTLASANQRRAGNANGRLDKVHLSVGGERFRPCMEDVLHLLITDFGVAKKDCALTAIQEGRARWRALQLSSAVRDNPAIAAKALTDCGYTVTPIDPKQPRLDKHTHY